MSQTNRLYLADFLPFADATETDLFYSSVNGSDEHGVFVDLDQLNPSTRDALWEIAGRLVDASEKQYQLIELRGFVFTEVNAPVEVETMVKSNTPSQFIWDLAALPGKPVTALQVMQRVTQMEHPQFDLFSEQDCWALRLRPGDAFYGDDGVIHTIRAIRYQNPDAGEGTECHIVIEAEKVMTLTAKRLMENQATFETC